MPQEPLLFVTQLRSLLNASHFSVGVSSIRPQQSSMQAAALSRTLCVLQPYILAARAEVHGCTDLRRLHTMPALSIMAGGSVYKAIVVHGQHALVHPPILGHAGINLLQHQLRCELGMALHRQN